MTLAFNAIASALAATAAFTLVQFGTMTAVAQNPADRDAKEVADYVLTEAALKKYTQAVRNLQPLMGQLPRDCDGEDQAKSLTDTAAQMDGVPQVKSALKAAGMTSREYLLFSWSLFQNGLAAWTLEQPGGTLPPGVKRATVNFYRSHEAELKRLGELNKQPDCDNR